MLSLLESDFARCKFFLIRDRDYLSTEVVNRHRTKSPNRLFVLNRYHIENYLLDEELISLVLREIYQRSVPAEQIRNDLFEIARNSAAFLRDLVAFRFGELYQAEDCSVGNHSSNQALLTAANEVDTTVMTPLREALLNKVAGVNVAISERTTIKIQTRCLIPA